MTKKKPSADKPPAKGVARLNVMLREGVSQERCLAEALLSPVTRHAMQAGNMAGLTLGDPSSDINENVAVIGAAAEKVGSGDLSDMTAILAAQAITLDTTFTAMLKRSALNLNQFPEAAERYMRMALKAQGQSRTTVEALAKIARGGEQIVRHIHVDNRGGQAVIAETVTTGGEGAEQAAQPHACFTALRSPDTLGDGVPLPSDAEWALSDARREVAGSTEGQS